MAGNRERDIVRSDRRARKDEPVHGTAPRASSVAEAGAMTRSSGKGKPRRLRLVDRRSPIDPWLPDDEDLSYVDLIRKLLAKELTPGTDPERPAGNDPASQREGGQDNRPPPPHRPSSRSRSRRK